MPEYFRRSAVSLLVVSLFSTAALAESAPESSALAPSSPASAASTAAAAPDNSEMDAPLFYQLLVGELELRTGQAGVAYQVLLDAARRTKDETLFQRVVNIAVQARAGDQALIAAKAWRDAVPASLEAQQSTIQLLAVLNRPAEVVDPLRSLLALTPEPQRASVLASLPRLFMRAAEPKKVYAALEPILQTAAQQPSTRPVALVVQARLALMAGDTARALALTQEVSALAPDAEESMQLALELMPAQPAAEALIVAQLQLNPDNHALRLAYGRALSRAQRTAEAAREFQSITVTAPTVTPAWFALGTLELEMRHGEAADAALREYLQRLPANPPENEAVAVNDARQQTWLMLSQAAEIRGDMKASESWLLKVDSPQRLVEAQFRRASLLARQGKLAEARKVIQALPGETDDEQRAKLMAESQLLRDARDWKQAYDVLARANERFPDDADLLYEQSMMAEKLDRMDEMESLLKRVMSLKPDHHHAYNALGYSLAERNLRLEEARTLIAKALSYAPAEPFIVDSMGWVEFRLGNNAEALRLLRQAYGSRPDAEIAAHLGEVLWVSGEREEARKVFQEGSRRDPKNEALQETLTRLRAKL